MRKLFIILLTAMTVITANAQNNVTVPEPEFIGQVVVLTSDSTGITLPKEKSAIKASGTHWGMVPVPGLGLLDKAKTKLVLAGRNAANNFKAGTIRFVIRVEKQEADPASYLRIVKFEVKKKTRESVISEFGLIQGMSADFSSSESFDVKKYGESSLLISLQVEPGQYGVSMTSLFDACTFGVE